MTVEEAREFVSDAALWPRARDFMWDFAPQIHPSWLEGLELGAFGAGSDAGDAFLASCLQSPRVKKFILSSLGIEPVFHTFPKGDWSRLLVLDGATLLEIAKWLGAIVCAAALRRVTDGASVRGLKAALGGVYPEVFGFTIYFKGLENLCGEAPGRSAEDAVSAGAAILQSLVAPLPEPLSARLKFKLPKTVFGSASARETADSVREAGTKTDFGAAMAKLLKLKFPEAYSLCC